MKKLLLILLFALPFIAKAQTLTHLEDSLIHLKGYSYTRMDPMLIAMIDSIRAGGGTYTGTSPTTATVGGIASGTAISGLSYTALWQALLVPYVNPVFTGFSITGQATTVENGTTLSGAKTYTWSMTLNSGVVPTIDLYNNTTAATLLAGTANDGTQSQTITTIQLNTPGATQSWKGIGNNTSPVSTFNSSNFIVTAYYLQFWGPVSSTVTNSATIRALGSSSFHTGAMSFTMVTGTTLSEFDVAIPPGSAITSVIDTDALGADITSSYVSIGSINVTDAGGTSRSYPCYKLVNGVPYSTNHHHVITVN